MKYISTIAFLVLYMNLLAQESIKDKIQYDFPPRVDTIIAIAIDSAIIYDSQKNDNAYGYYLTFYPEDTTYMLVLDVYCKDCPIYDSIGEIDDWIGFLVKHTNRYTKITGREVPVILESDLRFGILKLVDEANYGRVKAQMHWEFRRRFNILVGRRNNKIYKIGFW